jgi:hypothetical protein
MHSPRRVLIVACRFPYPGQWGTIIFTWSSVLTMFAGAISAMVESLGDYYAGVCAGDCKVQGLAVPLQGHAAALATCCDLHLEDSGLQSELSKTMTFPDKLEVTPLPLLSQLRRSVGRQCRRPPCWLAPSRGRGCAAASPACSAPPTGPPPTTRTLERCRSDTHPRPSSSTPYCELPDVLRKPHTARACSAQITGVGSRRVIQVASVLIMVVAVIGAAAASSSWCLI